jgi:hypothetical protein
VRVCPEPSRLTSIHDARTVRVLGPHRAAAHASESALLAPGHLPPLGSRPCTHTPTLPASAPCLLQRLFLPSSRAHPALVPTHAYSRVAHARSKPQTYACTGPTPRPRSALRQRSSSTPVLLTSVSPAQPTLLRTCRTTSTSTLLLHAASSRCSRSGTGHAAPTPCVRAHRLRSSQPPAPARLRSASRTALSRLLLQQLPPAPPAFPVPACRPRTWPSARLPRALVLAGPHAARPEPRAPAPPRSSAALPRARPRLSPRRPSQLRLDLLHLAELLSRPKPPRSPQCPAPASRPLLGPSAPRSIPLAWAARLPLGPRPPAACPWLCWIPSARDWRRKSTGRRTKGEGGRKEALGCCCRRWERKRMGAREKKQRRRGKEIFKGLMRNFRNCRDLFVKQNFPSI